MGDGNRRSWNLDRLKTNNSLRKWRSVKMFQDFAALSFCHGIFQKILWLASYFWFGTLPSWVNSIPESSFGTIGDLKKMSFDIHKIWLLGFLIQFAEVVGFLVNCPLNKLVGFHHKWVHKPISTTLQPADLLVWICQPHFQHLWCDAFNHAGLLTPGKH